MGICSSIHAISIATVKLILQDGQLQEYYSSVKVSYVLAKYPKTFICNADELEFDDVVSALDDSEDLQMGQLYFALPISKLKHPFQAAEIAALAVKASSALRKSGCAHQFSPAICSGDRTMSPADGDLRRVRSRRNGDRRRRDFTAVLTAIPE